MINKRVERLQALQPLKEIPLDELRWLAQHGEVEVNQAGIVNRKGSKADKLWIILQGSISVRIDRGAGPKVVNTELKEGNVTGKLPYSRLLVLPGDAYADEYTETLTIAEELFPQMINSCPLFTAYTVHSMIDRTRIHTSSAMQDEKMMALGKLAAGLAHELNNPASVAIRDAKLLGEGQEAVDQAFRLLNKAGLNDEQFERIQTMRQTCVETSRNSSMSVIEKADLQDKISDWLEGNSMDSSPAAVLADLALASEDLDNMLKQLPAGTTEAALQWIVARCSLDKLIAGIEQSTNQICQLVDAVKKFTRMDNLAERELINIESAICETLKLLETKAKARNAHINMQIAKQLPGVYANGAEFNQIWFSLLDNALDAIPDAGKIEITAAVETDLVAVHIVDNGPGIPADKLDSIFDPFYTTKAPGQGTGLGLDISRRLIRSYNGDINVKSKPGRTEFCVNLQIGVRN